MARSMRYIWDGDTPAWVGEIPDPPTETRVKKLRQWLYDHGLFIYGIAILTLLAIAYIMEN